jgi:glycine/D-amino acid oxidase-like deaminating enzyme
VSGQTLRYHSDVKQFLNIVKGTKSIIWNGNDIFVGSTSIKSESPSLIELKKERDELKTFLLETVDADVELKAIEPLSSGHGIRVLSKSRAPIWGYNDDKTFLFLTGMYKNGLQLAPLLSREIAESIENNTDFSDFKYQS